MSNTTEKKNIVIPIALVGTIVGLILSGLAIAKAWGANEVRLTNVEQQVIELKQSLALLQTVDKKVDRLTVLFEKGAGK